MIVINAIQTVNGRNLAICSNGAGISVDCIEGDVSVGKSIEFKNNKWTIASGAVEACET